MSRPADQPLLFDLDLARRETPENPCVRVRAACALAWRLAGEAGQPDPNLALEPELLVRAYERALLRKLVDFPDEVRAAAREREPYRITRYLLEAADALAAFLQERPSGNAEASATDRALLRVAAIVLRNGLDLLGIESNTAAEQD